MSKTQLNLNIDSDVLDSVRLKFPRKISSIVEDFLKSILGFDYEPNNKADTKKKIMKLISEKSFEMNNIKASLKVLSNQLEEEEEKANKRIDKSIKESKTKYFDLPTYERLKISNQLENEKRKGLVDEKLTPVEYFNTLKKGEW